MVAPLPTSVASPLARMIVVTSKGVHLPSGNAAEDLALGLRELEVLVGLTGVAEIDDAHVATIAEELGESREDLEAFVDELRGRGWLAKGTSAPSTAHDTAPDSPPSGVTVGGEAVGLPVPTVFRIVDGRITAVDHFGAELVALSPRELVAAAVLTKQQDVEAGYRAQVDASGDRALSHDEWTALVARLVAAGVVKPAAEDSFTLLRGHDRNAEALKREVQGHRTVAAEIARRAAESDAREAERRSAGAAPRVKVYPVHSIKTAWRNPPLSLGLILAYVNAYEDGRLTEDYDIRLDWLIDPDNIDGFVDEPAVFLYSNYIWSSERNLAVSRNVKAANPASVMIHGGPNVPKYERDVAAFFRDNPHVDVAVHGEGEVATAEILDKLRGAISPGVPPELSVLADVPGITYRDGDSLVRTGDRERLTDLDVIPSPYLTGLFDAYAEGWRKVAERGGTGVDGWSYLLPVVVLETNRGCPYGCTFCDWGSATMSRIRKFSLERINAELGWCAENKVDTVGLADANFGILERDVDITRRVTELKSTVGFPQQFGTNYAKNTVKHLRQIVELLTEADILSFGLLSLQSMDARTLDTINRSNIKLEKYEDLASEFRQAKLPLYVDLMVGLPGQTVQSFTNDLQECADREVHGKVFQTQLLVNSPMNAPDYREQFGIVNKPGELVIRSASFTTEDYERMLDLRQLFLLVEKFGLFRHTARYLRQETGLTEMEIYTRIYDEAVKDPSSWPSLSFTVEVVPRLMVQPASWALVFAELRRFCVEVFGVADDAALESVLAVSLALAPARNRTFPYTVELDHDFVAWHDAMLAAKDEGHLKDWPEHIKRLRTYGPGSLTVDDPRGVCEHELGRIGDVNPWDTWDLESPVSRAVTRGL